MKYKRCIGHTFKLMRHKWFYKLILILFTILVFIYSFNLNFMKKEKHFLKTIQLKSKCPCQTEIVSIKSYKNDKYNIDINDPFNSQNAYNYNISTRTFEELNLGCDLYKVLRRGKHQKIISFSLYGNFRPHIN